MVQQRRQRAAQRPAVADDARTVLHGRQAVVPLRTVPLRPPFQQRVRGRQVPEGRAGRRSLLPVVCVAPALHKSVLSECEGPSIDVPTG